VNASSQKYKIAVTQRMPEPIRERILRDFDARLDVSSAAQEQMGSWIQYCDGVDAILCTPADRMSAADIAALSSSVRVISTFSVGYDHIDVRAATAHGILVTNTPGVVTDATADIALLLLLGAARRATEGQALARSGAWRGWNPTQLLGNDLTERVLGIVGMGRIGQAVAKRAISFGMHVHYLSGSDRPKSLPFPARQHCTENTFWSACEFLSLHLPSTPENYHFLNAQRLSQMPCGSILVNTSRGEIVDDDAVIAALHGGRLAAVGLDVYPDEPRIPAGYLALPNAFLLPHLGSATHGTRLAMGVRALDNIDAVLRGDVPQDCVNEPA